MIALICCLPVYLQWKTAMEAFSAAGEAAACAFRLRSLVGPKPSEPRAEAQGQKFSSNVSLPVIIMETDIYQSEASAGSVRGGPDVAV